MKFKFPYQGYNVEDLIRRCGYGKINNPHTNETSYKRALGSGFYPRFHVYIYEYDNYFEVNLHLDQKKASYEGTTAHSGEYDGDLVDNEARRITKVIADIYGVAV
ncbi:TPA: hypothetical protein DF272_02360 [Candidatus Falkowbacteria bacterium]|nr:hypothetical protein [Candidatus Falkowbacteria bacterium]